MLFNSILYAVFLPAVVAIYSIAPFRLRLWILLLASYLFYASWNPLYLFLILALTVVNYLLGLGLDRFHYRPKTSTWLLMLGISLNLGVLGYYKYTLFLLHNLAIALGWLGYKVPDPHFSLIIPLGISFFIFEFIHYLVDVHKGQLVVKSPLKFAVFAAFFPTQIAGPIKRYENFIPQIEGQAPLDWDRVGTGLKLIVTGLFKKTALADNLAPLVLVGFQQASIAKAPLNQEDAWLVVVAFAMQIYFDFSGYTDIGRGSALLLGFSVPENFKRPYLATNISDFWHRWHISLSTWLRDYLYRPLGGSRKQRFRNLFLTMAIGGLWHGANWTFVIWGAFHGFLLIIFWKLKLLRPASPANQPSTWKPLYSFLGRALTFLLVCLGWVFFRAATLQQALAILGAMVGWQAGNTHILLPTQRGFILLVAGGCFAVEALLEWLEQRYAKEESAELRWTQRLASWGRELQPLGYVLLFTLTLLVEPISGPRFIYFQF